MDLNFDLDDRIKDLEEKIDGLAEQLAENFYQTILVLASLVTQLERFYEGSHSRFVSEKSALLADELGLSPTEIFEVKTAGLLHDIGKVGFKDSLLFKYTNEMSQSEYNRFILHPEIGMQILKKHHGFDTIAEIVYQHHERLDGSGFPRHLQLNSIHPGAAIIGVVETYHNMMFKRQRDRINTASSSIKYSSAAAYMETTKDRFSSAMNFLHQKKGVLFNTKAVDKFTEMIKRERLLIGKRTVMRVPVNNIKPGMILAEDYFTSSGLLIAGKGESILSDMINILTRFAESGDIPMRILVMN